jgi:hypothetical protein
MSASEALCVQMTMQQFAELCDQLALGLGWEREPQGWEQIHWIPPLGQDGPGIA